MTSIARVRAKRALRRQLYEEQGELCFWCRKRMIYVESTLDRLKPGSQNGRYTRLNCVASCSPCNTQRGNLTVPEWITVLKLRGVKYWDGHEERLFSYPLAGSDDDPRHHGGVHRSDAGEAAA